MSVMRLMRRGMAEDWTNLVEQARQHESVNRAWLRLKTYIAWERLKPEALRRLTEWFAAW